MTQSDTTALLLRHLAKLCSIAQVREDRLKNSVLGKKNSKLLPLYENVIQKCPLVCRHAQQVSPQGLEDRCPVGGLRGPRPIRARPQLPPTQQCISHGPTGCELGAVWPAGGGRAGRARSAAWDSNTVPQTGRTGTDGVRPHASPTWGLRAGWGHHHMAVGTDSRFTDNLNHKRLPTSYLTFLHENLCGEMF